MLYFRTYLIQTKLRSSFTSPSRNLATKRYSTAKLLRSHFTIDKGKLDPKASLRFGLNGATLSPKTI